MTVEKNIAYGLKRDGLPRAEIATRVTDMLSLVQMDAFAARKPHQLSGGQRQRVALARSLVKNPNCCCWTNRWVRWTRNCARRLSLN